MKIDCAKTNNNIYMGKNKIDIILVKITVITKYVFIRKIHLMYVCLYQISMHIWLFIKDFERSIKVDDNDASAHYFTSFQTKQK